MKKLKACIFISDEGFGHAVRQRSIISQLLKKNIYVKVVTSKKIYLLKEKFGNLIQYKDQYNNIETKKKVDGSLDILRTKKQFNIWYNNTEKWISNEMKKSRRFDFFISDFVPEAFELAKRLNIRCYGVCHFTWDWFYKKILRGQNRVLRKLERYIAKAEKIYFPPLTSKDNLRKYKNRAKLVNFILSDFNFKQKSILGNKKPKCLIMDNGNSTLRSVIIKTIPYLKKIKNIEFIIRTDLLDQKSQKEIMEANNLIPVSGLKNTHSKILECDFLVARGGYNTISECLVLNKPALLFEEKNNPEINYNLNTVNNLNLCDLLKKKDWGKNFKKKINYFYKHKLKKIKKTLEKKNFANTGSKEIVLDIIKQHRNL